LERKIAIGRHKYCAFSYIFNSKWIGPINSPIDQGSASL
jgi:hypothetical protein